MQPPRRPTSRLGRLTWRLHNPLIALLCTVGLATSAASLPRGKPKTLAILERLKGVEIPAGGRVQLVYLFRASPFEPLQLIDPDSESWDRMSRLVVDHPLDLLEAQYSLTLTRSGVWYPSETTMRRAITIAPLFSASATFSPAELRSARKIFVQWLRDPGKGNDTEAAAAVERLADDETLHETNMRAIAANTASVAGLAVLGFSLSGLPRYLRVVRAQRLLKESLCGVCRYDLSAATPHDGTLTCPECGAEWLTTELPLHPQVVADR